MSVSLVDTNARISISCRLVHALDITGQIVLGNNAGNHFRKGLFDSLGLTLRGFTTRIILMHATSSPPPKTVTLYTDGACSGNPGPGGWAAILMYNGTLKELSGFEADTTNNRMELLAVIKGLEALKEDCCVIVYSDSKYVVQGMTDWIHGWIKNHWRNSSKQPVKNKELWMRLHALTQSRHVKFQWVKGHHSNPHNNRCDELAVEQIKRQRLSHY